MSASLAAPAPRLHPEEGLALLAGAELLELAERANEARAARHLEPVITYLIDTNPNYTNVCEARCLFCSFYREPDAPEAFTLGVEQVLERIARAVARGATTVLLQGGLHPKLPLGYYLDLVRETRRRFPGVTAHFFSAPEVAHLARRSGLSLRAVLERLYEAGQRTLPGGGAEILSKRVRQRVSPRKGSVEEWLAVHREAHRVGMRTTATMMYGHLETDGEVIEHLDVLRRLQDETGGFTAFIPWSYKPFGNRLRRFVPEPAAPSRYLRLLAVARLYLDNFEHVQASWFPEGRAVGQIALHFGADDFGGTLLEEHVHEAAGHTNQATRDEVVRWIEEAGFRAVQRTTLYEPVVSPPAER